MPLLPIDSYTSLLVVILLYSLLEFMEELISLLLYFCISRELIYWAYHFHQQSKDHICQFRVPINYSSYYSQNTSNSYFDCLRKPDEYLSETYGSYVTTEHSQYMKKSSIHFPLTITREIRHCLLILIICTSDSHYYFMKCQYVLIIENLNYVCSSYSLKNPPITQVKDIIANPIASRLQSKNNLAILS